MPTRIAIYQKQIQNCSEKHPHPRKTNRPNECIIASSAWVFGVPPKTKDSISRAHQKTDTSGKRTSREKTIYYIIHLRSLKGTSTKEAGKRKTFGWRILGKGEIPTSVRDPLASGEEWVEKRSVLSPAHDPIAIEESVLYSDVMNRTTRAPFTDDVRVYGIARIHRADMVLGRFGIAEHRPMSKANAARLHSSTPTGEAKGDGKGTKNVAGSHGGRQKKRERRRLRLRKMWWGIANVVKRGILKRIREEKRDRTLE